ncbi:MAG: hypothetical protein JJE45_00245 [Prolixibacteraceae bacterium]|nr:hypothetical protein [Prolixibacteraceae bacterium]
MSNKLSYTAKEIRGKYIACSVLLDPPGLGAVLYAAGPYKGLPVLYNQIESAQDDRFFDDEYDHVIPAIEYFGRVASNNFKF